MSDVETKRGLHHKLAEVVAEVEGVSKDGFNDFHKYQYATAEAVLRAIRRPLSARFVTLLPSLIDIGEREIRTAKGGVSTITTVKVRFTFTDAETGETVASDWAGQGDDPGDKGLGKAYTNAIKTFLREAFQIPQGDDPEADKRADERASQRVATPTPVAAPSPLGAEARAKVLKAIADAGQNPALVFAAVNLGSAEEMTAAHAFEIRGVLDGATS